MLPTAAYPDFEVELGMTNVSYRWSDAHYIRLSQRFGDNKFAVGLAHTDKQFVTKCPGGEPTCGWETWSAIPNLLLDVTRYFQLGKYVEVGIGPSFAQNTNRFTTERFNVHLDARLRYKDFIVGLHHYSNAGTSSTGWNMGQDAVVIGWRFN